MFNQCLCSQPPRLTPGGTKRTFDIFFRPILLLMMSWPPFTSPPGGNQRKLWLQHHLAPPQRTATFPHPSKSSRLKQTRKTIQSLAAKIANRWMVGAFPLKKKINVWLITTMGHHRKGKWRFVLESIYVMIYISFQIWFPTSNCDAPFFSTISLFSLLLLLIVSLVD